MNHFEFLVSDFEKCCEKFDRTFFTRADNKANTMLKLFELY